MSETSEPIPEAGDMIVYDIEDTRYILIGISGFGGGEAPASDRDRFTWHKDCSVSGDKLKVVDVIPDQIKPSEKA